ncbi:MAG: hypothetical protein M1522_06840 [Actinobacteria bacterium]|nr:hypothetical protein [Actinomycetota bacterium]
MTISKSLADLSKNLADGTSLLYAYLTSTAHAVGVHLSDLPNERSTR